MSLLTLLLNLPRNKLRNIAVTRLELRHVHAAAALAVRAIGESACRPEGYGGAPEG